MDRCWPSFIAIRCDVTVFVFRRVPSPGALFFPTSVRETKYARRREYRRAMVQTTTPTVSEGLCAVSLFDCVFVCELTLRPLRDFAPFPLALGAPRMRGRCSRFSAIFTSDVFLFGLGLKTADLFCLTVKNATSFRLPWHSISVGLCVGHELVNPRTSPGLGRKLPSSILACTS